MAKLKLFADSEQKRNFLRVMLNDPASQRYLDVYLDKVIEICENDVIILMAAKQFIERGEVEDFVEEFSYLQEKIKKLSFK